MRLPRPSLPRLEAQASETRAQPPASDTPSCRVCWGEAEAGNALLTPCGCKGTAAHIHEDCLRQWLAAALEQHGPEGTRSCGVCLGEYRLPGTVPLPLPGLRQRLRLGWRRCLEGPAGPPISGLLMLGMANSFAGGVFGAVSEMAAAVEALELSRLRPADAAGLLLPRVCALVALERMRPQDMERHLAGAVRSYLGGVLLDQAAMWVRATAGSVLPPLLARPIQMAFWLPMTAGLGLQAVQLAYIYGHTGLLKGGVLGFANGVAAPFKLARALGVAAMRAAAFGAMLLMQRRIETPGGP